MARERTTAQHTKSAVLLVLALGASALVGCGFRANEPLGGETHFLRQCDPLTAVCGGGLSCLDQVCTEACSIDVDCVAFGAAQCSATSVLPAGEPRGRCEMACDTDEDCLALSDAHRCAEGSCRAPAWVGVVPDAEVTSVDVDLPCSPTTLAAESLVVLGDSFFRTEHPLSVELASLAEDAGLVDEGSAFRDGSSLFDNALAFGGRGIETQYVATLERGPAEVVVLNGGGADVLLGSCDLADATCPLLLDAADALQDLLARFAADGVDRVVYAFYPDALLPDVRARMDALRPLVADICRESAVPCAFVDLRPSFSGHYDEYIGADGLNPTPAGTRAAAAQILDTLGECP